MGRVEGFPDYSIDLGEFTQAIGKGRVIEATLTKTDGTSKSFAFKVEDQTVDVDKVRTVLRECLDLLDLIEIDQVVGGKGSKVVDFQPLKEIADQGIWGQDVAEGTKEKIKKIFKDATEVRVKSPDEGSKVKKEPKGIIHQPSDFFPPDLGSQKGG